MYALPILSHFLFPSQLHVLLFSLLVTLVFNYGYPHALEAIHSSISNLPASMTLTKSDSHSLEKFGFKYTLCVECGLSITFPIILYIDIFIFSYYHLRKFFSSDFIDVVVLVYLKTDCVYSYDKLFRMGKIISTKQLFTQNSIFCCFFS